MLHVLGCITQQHDLRLVVLAGVLCLFACFAAMSLLMRARASLGHTRNLWLAAAGLVAGCGIWGTHFVAMLAYRPGFPVAYDPGLTALSVIIAVMLCGLGFWLSLTKAGPVIGGAVTGAAIGTMHYVGMAAVRVPADAIWDWRYVAASAVIGIAAMAGGMKLVTGDRDWRHLMAGAVVFTLAICSMHFTGMSAVTYSLDPSVIIPNAVLEPTSLAIAVAAIAVLIVALGLIGSLVDSHLSSRAMLESTRLRAHVQALEATKDRLEQTSESLRLALETAAAANKAKSAFLAAMSHELRTPLNAVIGFSDMLMSESFGPLGNPRNKEYVTDINHSGVHLLSLINDILDLARIDAGDTRLEEIVTDPAEIISECLRMVGPQADAAGVHLVDQRAENAPLIRVDERRLKQVLLNLLGNAVKFTRPGGTVDVRLSGEADGLAITVRDTGIGMAEKDIPLARERFGQVDSTLARKYEGAGLGLPIAIQITELHGGRLEIQSKPGVGTTVTVHLPVDRVVARAASVAA